MDHHQPRHRNAASTCRGWSTASAPPLRRRAALLLPQSCASPAASTVHTVPRNSTARRRLMSWRHPPRSPPQILVAGSRAPPRRLALSSCPAHSPRHTAGLAFSSTPVGYSMEVPSRAGWRRPNCIEGTRRVLNFAGHQVLRAYGFFHIGMLKDDL